MSSRVVGKDDEVIVNDLSGCTGTVHWDENNNPSVQHIHATMEEKHTKALPDKLEGSDINTSHAHIIASNNDRFDKVKAQLLEKYPHLEDRPDTPEDKRKIQRVSYDLDSENRPLERHQFRVVPGTGKVERLKPYNIDPNSC